MVLNDVLLQLVRWFVERQIMKWGKEIDWTKVKIDCDTRLRALIHNSVMDDVAIEVVNALIDLVANYFLQNQIAVGAPVATDVMNTAWKYASDGLVRYLATKSITVPVK